MRNFFKQLCFLFECGMMIKGFFNIYLTYTKLKSRVGGFHWISFPIRNPATSCLVFLVARDEICFRTGSVLGQPPYYSFRTFWFTPRVKAKDGEESSQTVRVYDKVGCFLDSLSLFFSNLQTYTCLGRPLPSEHYKKQPANFLYCFSLYFLDVAWLSSLGSTGGPFSKLT